MNGYVTIEGIIVAIPLGVGLFSLYCGDNWGWGFIGAAILIAVLLIRRTYRKEENK